MYHPIFLGAFVNIFIIILAVWTIPWKIYAVWLAAKRNQKAWFVVLLFVNTASILEMIYVFKIVKKNWTAVKADFHKGWEILKHTKLKDFKSKEE